jgi:hypothetical protein
MTPPIAAWRVISLRDHTSPKKDRTELPVRISAKQPAKSATPTAGGK